MSPFITFIGQSNREYTFTALPLNRKLPNSAGVYVVTNTVSDKEKQILHHPLRVGSCDDLSKLFNESEIQEMRNAGGNMVCIKIEEVTETRQQIEEDLQAKYLS